MEIKNSNFSDWNKWKSKEERLLQELWRVGDTEHRKALSRMIVRMVQVDDK